MSAIDFEKRSKILYRKLEYPFKSVVSESEINARFEINTGIWFIVI